MCSVFGALVWGLIGNEEVGKFNSAMQYIANSSQERGRDGRGFLATTHQPQSWNTKQWCKHYTDLDRGVKTWPEFLLERERVYTGVFIGNTRAEPTTEYTEDKRRFDQQPYTCGDWAVVHNGTIANDKELRTGRCLTKIDSACIPEQLNELNHFQHDHFANFVHDTFKGSYAILSANMKARDHIYYACNYRPLWYVECEFGVFFASSKDYLPPWLGVATMIRPYSGGYFRAPGAGETRAVHYSTTHHQTNNRTLVVCSGGLDSTVAAAKLIAEGREVELVHFEYGSRAQQPEVWAVRKIAKALGVPLHFQSVPIYKASDSPLLQHNSEIAGGEAGAEFAHEWVPARNLVMLAVATAFAEANNFSSIALGNNLEEAGAYPDNEPEFINRMNDVMPFAVGCGKAVRIEMPVGNLMKHEIVALGLEIGAPLDSTWSCYRAGNLHCGKCGPCFMRRKAFEINGAPEVINYQE
ncbi:putative queuosine biosynthesis protein [Pseudomonas phage MiCath]|uniref:7-cyano-7-deazaguanine synthase n=1 Tax=Pseudomonas phage MiCath TaxID=3003729 RepID=A0AAF0AFX5_9CAUD|nr:putative queuosine biosynthesis protein [Pseudomonas phage MiCath]WAX22407.1 putative queuosine biosynthesis protein [Pseudomonas phage MiCath]